MARVPGSALLKVLFGTGPGRHRRPGKHGFLSLVITGWHNPWRRRAHLWTFCIYVQCITWWGSIWMALQGGGYGVMGKVMLACLIAMYSTLLVLVLLCVFLYLVFLLPRRRLADGSGRTYGRGLDRAGGLVPELPGAGWRWRALGVVARVMPRAAGRRWLAEAESSLFEMDPGQRAAGVRSYLRSAPRVVAMTWGREVARRTRRRAG